MKRISLLIIAVTLAFLFLLPYSAGAQDFEIPSQARQLVPESDMVEMIGHMTRWKSADLYAHLEASDEVLTPLFGDIRVVLGPQASLTDVAAIRMDYESKIAAIYQSTTVTEAEGKVRDLLQSGESVRNQFLSLAGQMQTIATQLEKKGLELQKELTAKLNAWSQAEDARINQQIGDENGRETAALQARMEQQAMAMAQSLAAAAGKNANPVLIKSQVDAAMAPIIAQTSTELREKMARRGKELEQQMHQAAEKKADELSGGQFSLLTRIRDNSQNVSQRIEQLAGKKAPTYDAYYQKFLKKKGEIIIKTIEAQIAPAKDAIRSFAADIEIGRKAGRSLPSADELLSRLDQDKQALATRLIEAKSDATIDEAVNQFKVGWEDIRKSLEAARAKGAQEIIDTTRAKLSEKDTENTLCRATQDIAKGISDIEKARVQGKSTSKSEENLRKLRQLLPQVREGVALIDEFNNAKASDDIGTLLDLKNRLQAKLMSIQRCYEEASLIPGYGIFIEAENESSTQLLPPDVFWHSTKEVDATWRPGSSGKSDWYLSRGGEKLVYNFTVAQAGTYILWIRDLATSDKMGERSVSVAIDGTEYGVFAENPSAVPEPGAFGWHKTCTALLNTGEHMLVVTKADTTRGAAILDCFYFTSDPGDIPK